MATAKRAGTARTGAAKRTTKRAAKQTSKPATKQTTRAAKRPARQTDGNYTDPALRERLKRRIMASTKGGRAGQWSARKAQLLAHEYEAQGGGYTGPKTESQRHLDQWTHEEWTTADGAPARRGKTTARYLPKKAWDELTPAERRSTEKKKRAASKRGEQFVANTGPAAAARRNAAEDGSTSAKRPAAKRPAAKRATAKRASAEHAPAKRTGAKRTGAKRASAKPAASKRAIAKRTSRTR